MRYAELVEPILPAVKCIAVGDGEGQVVQAGALRIKRVRLSTKMLNETNGVSTGGEPHVKALTLIPE